MKKVICDACGVDKAHNNFVFRTHVQDIKKGFATGGYITGKGMHPTSGRHFELDLCCKCYNDIAGAAFEKFEQLRNNNNMGQYCEH